MTVLLVGCSSIARRRILPALDGMGFEGIDIATELRQADADAADSSEQGWSQMFELLATLLEEA